MPDGASIAAASMHADAARVDILSQNLANLLTPGYKRRVAVGGAEAFSSLVSHAASSVASKAAEPSPAGMAAAAAGTDFRQGPLRPTGNPLDLGIEGGAFFEIVANGVSSYTRQGNFMIDAMGQLIAPGGGSVAGLAGSIRLESAQVRVDRDGRLFEQDRLVGQLRLVRFEDPRELAPAANGRYLQGAARILADGADGAHLAGVSGSGSAVRQGFLEASNVVAAEEMVRLIQATRHFEAGQKVIQWYGDMHERVLVQLGEF
ncbi:flagellar hook-basal body protein [Lacisediminimonas profundi]|uniref:flagellar hook-basal body protein n=1 Tax=Lacisediminimonas profundi TaxID=2603856 RepID=UPI00124AFFE2|nr:flagellar hook-basal body protein [Lacisediminimonas profundi]